MCERRPYRIPLGGLANCRECPWYRYTLATWGGHSRPHCGNPWESGHLLPQLKLRWPIVPPEWCPLRPSPECVIWTASSTTEEVARHG